MKIKYNITKEDYWQFNKHSIYGNDKVKFMRILLNVAIPLMVFVTMYTLYGKMIMALIGAFVALGITYYVSVYSVKSRVFKIAEKDDYILGNHTINASERGILEKTFYNSSFFRWRIITEIESTENYIFIHVKDNQSLFIPKREFYSENEAIKFYNFLMRNWRKIVKK